MIFRGVENQSVELKLVSYEFPNNRNVDEHDKNWLNVFIKVDSKIGKWQAIDPSLLTWEVVELRTWFSCLAENKEVEDKLMGFTEPNLSFELRNECNSEIKTIRMHFNIELLPKSAISGREYFVDFKFNKDDLKQIVIDLSEEIKKYPER